jgi:predicted RNA-binding protein with PUA-like domain
MVKPITGKVKFGTIFMFDNNSFKLKVGSKFYLAKSEPNSFSIDDLKKEEQTWWDGVHNYQAINVIKTMNPGDMVFFYRSVNKPAIVGLMKVLSKPILDQDDPRGISWKVKMGFFAKTDVEVSLKQIKATGIFDDFALVRQSRLSVMACTKEFTAFVLARL